MKVADVDLGKCNTVNTALWVQPGATLRISSKEHNRGRGWTGGYDLADGEGRIIWGEGFLLFLK